MPGHRLPINLKCLLGDGDRALKRCNEILPQIDFKCLKRDIICCLHAAINKFIGDFEFFSKYAQPAST